MCLWPAALALRQLALWAAAGLVTHAAGLNSTREALVAALRDDVYARLILAMLGSVEVRGPFADGWTLEFASGSSAVGVQVVQVLVNGAFIAVGAALLMAVLLRWRAGARGGLFSPALVGSILAACGVGSQMRLSWSSGSGGEMALSMVATKVLGLDSRLYDAALRQGALVSAGINLLGVLLAAVLGAAVVAVPVWLWRHRPARRSRADLASRPRTRWQPGLPSVVVLALLGWSAAHPAVAFEGTRPAAAPVGVQHARLAAMVSHWPSVVTVTPSSDGHSWQYAVNGHRETIRGIGYNAITIDDTPAERAARYDSDFEAISATGANTLVGWSEREFGDLLMDKAAEHGLGVILPFDLDASFAYEDPRVRAELLDAITRRVERYRDAPALRMWGLGNEVLHEIARARGSQARWDAFSPFLLEAADRIHQLDPNHPVVYRDAEDWYAEPIVQALAADGKSRPWFVYSMNFFTTRMDQALTDGKETPMHQALMISEFGPVGLRPEDRPGGYAELWGIIRRHQDRVLGGSAYVWTTAGPEPLDRNFGLTDANGQPVDGSLAELTSLYSSLRLQEER